MTLCLQTLASLLRYNFYCHNYMIAVVLLKSNSDSHKYNIFSPFLKTFCLIGNLSTKDLLTKFVAS